MWTNFWIFLGVVAVMAILYFALRPSLGGSDSPGAYGGGKHDGRKGDDHDQRHGGER